jgi:hypothetical protein
MGWGYLCFGFGLCFGRWFGIRSARREKWLLYILYENRCRQISTSLSFFWTICLPCITTLRWVPLVSSRFVSSRYVFIYIFYKASKQVNERCNDNTNKEEEKKAISSCRTICLSLRLSIDLSQFSTPYISFFSPIYGLSLPHTPFPSSHPFPLLCLPPPPLH